MCKIYDSIHQKNYYPLRTIYLRYNEVNGISFACDALRLEVYRIFRNTKGYLFEYGSITHKRDALRLVYGHIARKRDALRHVDCRIAHKRDALHLEVCWIMRKRDTLHLEVCRISAKKDTTHHASLLMSSLYNVYIQQLKSSFLFLEL